MSEMKQKNKILLLATLLGIVSAVSGCEVFRAVQTESADVSIPPAAPILSDKAKGDGEIRFYENKVKNDPEDFSANNKLAGLYLQKLRETGNVQFLDLAFRAARTSLDSVPDVRNSGGLAALALAEFASHDFTNARDHALRLVELEPTKSYPQGILGDALLELGEYVRAETAYKKITLLEKGSNYNSEIRFARLAQLKGDNQETQKHFATALTLSLALSAPPRETVAWLRWQLGETAFSVGDYKTAENHFRDSLITFPDYYRAIASLGKTRAAQSDLQDAIKQYEKVTKILPDPNYVATLGDLYKLAGREENAQRQYELVEQIGRLTKLNGALYNRQLALFYADHDLKAEEAYQLAAKEYESRKDIYGADALAWTALKAGKLNEAQAAIKNALRLGTNDAKLFYHAGMIEKSSGNKTAAVDYLQKALQLNPSFDILQMETAKSALREIQ
jgi:tetratricopeptide (TPR) repeat protein